VQTTKVKIASGGRIVLPAEYRRALGLREGEDAILVLEDQELRILSRREAIRRAQELVSQYIPEGRSLADELIAERRREAVSE
jgi:AbrB family looped-hinge helix DNA binding protein